jgi:hypothetical protein
VYECMCEECVGGGGVIVLECKMFM